MLVYRTFKVQNRTAALFKEINLLSSANWTTLKYGTWEFAKIKHMFVIFSPPDLDRQALDAGPDPKAYISNRIRIPGRLPIYMDF